jgi:hypothetical protein
MITVIGKHEVKDVKTWKIAFDSDETRRASVGIKVNGVYAAMENPNMITISMEFPNKEVLDGMMSSPEMQKVMAEAGVIGKPEFEVLTKI